MHNRSILEPTFEQHVIPRDFKKFPIKVGCVCGVATNDVDYITQVKETLPNGKQKLVWKCPVYSSWHSVITRAYSQNYKEKKPTYQNVTVCDEWHLLSNFRNWWMCNNVAGWHLDKDLLVKGNLTYSPETCTYVPHYLNTLMTDKAAARGDYPLGVCLDPHRVKPYVSRCWVGGKHKHIGYFATTRDAHRAWQLFKIKAIEDSITHYTEDASRLGVFDERIVSALEERISILQGDVDNGRETFVLH